MAFFAHPPGDFERVLEEDGSCLIETSMQGRDFIIYPADKVNRFLARLSACSRKGRLPWVESGNESTGYVYETVLPMHPHWSVRLMNTPDGPELIVEEHGNFRIIRESREIIRQLYLSASRQYGRHQAVDLALANNPELPGRQAREEKLLDEALRILNELI